VGACVEPQEGIGVARLHGVAVSLFLCLTLTLISLRQMMVDLKILNGRGLLDGGHAYICDMWVLHVNK
jgi:hypothetical protein